MSEKSRNEDAQAKVSRLCKDAIFHTIRGLNEINDQSQKLWNRFDIQDCRHHLRVAIEYLNEIDNAVKG